MKFRVFTTFLVNIFLACACNVAYAIGTAAGTPITNTVTLDYAVESIAQPAISSNTASVTVDELINVTLTWQDGSPVNVNTPDINDPLQFLLTNTGNGQEAFSLTRNNNLLGDNYNPINGTAGAIFLENGLAPGFQASGPNADTIYISGTNDPNLAANASQIIYVVSDTPAALVSGNTGNVSLTTAALTAGVAGSPVGTGFAGLGTGGSTAVTGPTQATATSIGGYIMSGVSANVNKTILSPLSASDLIPGTVMRYRITVTVSGAGSVQNMVISDPIPAEVTYVPNSISIGGTARTDAADADNTQFSSNTVSINLGNVTAPASFVIEFQATLN